MTLEELRQQIIDNGKICIGHDIFADLFSPGIEDDSAKERAYQFAKTNGFTLAVEDKEVCFIKA